MLVLLYVQCILPKALCGFLLNKIAFHFCFVSFLLEILTAYRVAYADGEARERDVHSHHVVEVGVASVGFHVHFPTFLERRKSLDAHAQSVVEERF